MTFAESFAMSVLTALIQRAKGKLSLCLSCGIVVATDYADPRGCSRGMYGVHNYEEVRT